MDNKKIKELLNKYKNVLIVAAIAIVGLGWFLLTPPSTEKVCEHFTDIASKEARKEADAEGMGDLFDQFWDEDEIVKECIADYDEDEEGLGMFEKNKQRRCILKADTINEIEDCEIKD